MPRFKRLRPTRREFRTLMEHHKMHKIWRFAAPLALLVCASTQARPVSYAGGTMLMSEWSSDARRNSLSYSPSFRWSAEVGQFRIDELDTDPALEIRYLRLNRLAKRWNLPSAQANAFVWAGLGESSGRAGIQGHSTRNLGFQLDYETRKIYTAMQSDWFHSRGFMHRLDSVSLGWAPYEHDYDRFATWLVAKASRRSGSDPKSGSALLLRLFNDTYWAELGFDNNGRPLGLLMINF